MLLLDYVVYLLVNLNGLRFPNKLCELTLIVSWSSIYSSVEVYSHVRHLYRTAQNVTVTNPIVTAWQCYST